MADKVVAALEKSLKYSKSEIPGVAGLETELISLLEESALNLGMVSPPVGFSEEEVPVDFNQYEGDDQAAWQFILTYVGMGLIRAHTFQKIWLCIPERFTYVMYAPDDYRNWLWLGQDTIVIDIASWADRREFVHRIGELYNEEIITGDYSVRHIRLAFRPDHEIGEIDSGSQLVRFPERTRNYGNPSISTVPPKLSPPYRGSSQWKVEKLVLEKYRWLGRIKPDEYGYDLLEKNHRNFGKDVRKIRGAWVIYGTGSPLDYLPVDDNTSILVIVALVSTTLGIPVPSHVKEAVKFPHFVAPWDKNTSVSDREVEP